MTAVVPDLPLRGSSGLSPDSLLEPVSKSS
jgi:hypothetical protein